MKKILFAIAIVLTISLAANAQGRDGYFSNYSNNDYINRGFDDGDGTGLPTILGGSEVGLEGDQPAPLGSGLLVLTALGAGYAVARKKRS